MSRIRVPRALSPRSETPIGYGAVITFGAPPRTEVRNGLCVNERVDYAAGRILEARSGS